MNKETLAQLHQLLLEFKMEREGIASDWNGEDLSFRSAGEQYTEEDAHTARELAECAGEILSFLNKFLNR